MLAEHSKRDSYSYHYFKMVASFKCESRCKRCLVCEYYMTKLARDLFRALHGRYVQSASGFISSADGHPLSVLNLQPFRRK
jgi:hypothetical protein